MRKLLSFFCFFVVISLITGNTLLAQINYSTSKPIINKEGNWVFDEAGNMIKTMQPILQVSPSRLHDFGTVAQADFVSHDFIVTNTGATPLVIKEVKGGCYCTKAEWQTQAIAPGEQGYIRVFYDTRSKLGKFRAAVNVRSNAFGSQQEHLFVEGEIVP